MLNIVWSLKGDDKQLTVRKISEEISCYVLILISKGSLYCICFNKSVGSEIVAT